MSAARGRWLSVAGALVALVMCVSASCSRDAGPSSPSNPPQAEATTPAEPSVAPTTQPLGKDTVQVFFGAKEGDGLVAELREIFETVGPGDRAKQIVADLLSGPASPESVRVIPQGVRLRQAFVLADGTAYLDFSTELTERLGGGSANERLVVYSIVDSVVLNVPEISRVAIMVNGRAVDTLNGHVDLRRPLRADTSLILGRASVRRFDRRSCPTYA